MKTSSKVTKPSEPTAIQVRLYDPENGDPPVKLAHLDSPALRQPQRSNLFTILWIEEGSGVLTADSARHSFSAASMWFLNPYQTFFATTGGPVRGRSLQFHANFFCIETHHDEIGCNGILFNNPYDDPKLTVRGPLVAEFRDLFASMEEELGTAGFAGSELLVSLLKILMIKATRLKLQPSGASPPKPADTLPPVLARLTEMIERNYQRLHRPASYASQLAMSPKALGKLAKRRFGKTITEMIQERILKHAKWQLLHTLRPVKEIAAEVGYADEFYFSRLFKGRTGLSPSAFRDYETRIRGGRNLSM